MNNNSKWINRRVQAGVGLMAVGLLVGVIGLALPGFYGELPFNARIITGIGILLLGIGVGYFVRYGAARRDVQTARRLVQEERDERTQLIRARAGNRAYLVSAAMTYIILMWVSFAERGSLPPLTSDNLWYGLASVVIAPLIIYVASGIYDQSHM